MPPPWIALKWVVLEAMAAHARESQDIARSVSLAQLEQYRKKRPWWAKST